MTHSRIDWEDLRFVLAVADAHSLSAAARLLGVNHTTVLRRINAFEERLGVRIFDRLASGYVLTAGGDELLAAAREMVSTVTALERRLLGQDLRLEGEIRVTTTDTMMASVLPGHLMAFRQRYPNILVSVSTSNQPANLSRRDADIAIRPMLHPPDSLVGRRMFSVAFAAYAAPSYLASLPEHETPLSEHRWVAPDESLANSSVAQWMRASLDEARVTLRVDSLLGLRAAAIAGIGAAALPCYLGDTTPGLARISAPISDMTTELWLLTHEDLRRTARVSAFLEEVALNLSRDRDLFEGRACSTNR